MTTRRAFVPVSAGQVRTLMEREDATPAELERARVGALLIVASEISSLKAMLERVDCTASRVLDALVKQGSSNADALARLVERLEDKP